MRYYTLSAVGLVLILLFLAWHFRSRYVDHLPTSLSSRLRYYAPLQTFEDAAENGFSTAAFDLSNNLAGDSRAGLDAKTLTEVRRIMEREHCDFDEARLIHTNRMFRKNGIDPNGFPIDPKAITSLG
ncbi:hypothetical protein BCR35DRAFT_310707 [Leucosporidium creatinivorum]|uniref:Uncharacterized protein n=1 Tax=Leucosporidium creatinivorum TaxID=106004 RepID=A0A1Y2CWJ8_9BASI|nr:hypothetical protein BCR35DRAFT_310707 [Leucosporidium creatinivorum]